ncbi:MAG: twitching motility protein PilT [Gemmatimonas sp. SG8_17]|nr:MAG: twitching motility protein PilT [Gemmatimonas sp. SG8_17]
MTDLVFVDTNVVVYARDAAHARKQSRAAAWMNHLWTTRAGRVSFQVLQEFYVTVTAKLKPGMKPKVAREEARALMSWDPIVAGASVIEGAWVVQDKYRLSWWDALIVSSALAASCSYLLTEDMQDGQIIDTMRVVSPFAHSPEELLG